MTFRYGDGTKYGASTYGAHTVTTRTLTWAVRVDWDNDGVLDGTNEVAYIDSGGSLKGRLQGLRVRLGREFVFNSSADGFEHAIPGTLELDMLDLEGRYDPYNTSGDLFDYLYKNQLIIVTIKDESTGTSYSVFYGYITDIKPVYGEVDKATIYADGAMNKLDSPIHSDVYTTAQYDDQIVNALTTAGWAGSTDIDTTVSDSMPYHWFSGKPAIEEIHDLADAAFGIFWVGEDGTANYVSRIGGDLSTQTITEADIDYDYKIQAPSPRDVLRNDIKIFSNTMRTATNAVMWTFQEVPFLMTPGTTYELFVTPQYNGKRITAATGATGVATATANTLANGTGTDTSAQISNTQYPTVSFATKIKWGVGTIYGSANYLTDYSLNADIVYLDDVETYWLDSDDTSITLYGKRSLSINTLWIQSLNSAQEYAANLLEKFSTPRPFPRFKFKRSAIGKQFTSPLFNLITINFASKGITGEFRVGHIERSWSINDPNVIDSIYYLEPNLSVSAASTWTFPMTFPTIFT